MHLSFLPPLILDGQCRIRPSFRSECLLVSSPGSVSRCALTGHRNPRTYMGHCVTRKPGAGAGRTFRCRISFKLCRIR